MEHSRLAPVMISPMALYNTNMNDPLTYLITKIPSSVSSKVTVGGTFYIVLGLVAAGLDIALLTNDYFSLGGIVNGVYLFVSGILLVHLCRHEVYVLTSLYILVFFELFLNITSIATFIIFLLMAESRCDFWTSVSCHNGSERGLLVGQIIIGFAAFCFTVYNLITISNGRQYQSHTLTSPTILYTTQPQMIPVSNVNPPATTSS